MKRPRIIGTTNEAIEEAEKQLAHNFPPSFRQWLLQNNGLSLSPASIYPVFDPRDPRTTWDSIVRQFDNGNWVPEYWDVEIPINRYLPFGAIEADTLCFDYRNQEPNSEAAVVLLSHETGQPTLLAKSFSEFMKLIEDKKIKT